MSDKIFSSENYYNIKKSHNQMKRQSKIVMAAIIAAFVGCPTDRAHRKDNVKNINGGLTPVSGEVISTYDEDIPINN